MTIFTALRWSHAVWVLPIALLLGSAHAATSLATHDGYPVSDMASSAYIVYFLCPVYAAATAFALRGWWRFQARARSRRLGLVVVANALGPLSIGTVVVTAVVVCAGAWTIPTDWPSVLVLLVAVAATVFAVIFGSMVSWALPTIVAVPVASFGCFMWVAYLPATSSPLLHYVTPTITGCCATLVQPSIAYMSALAGLISVLVVGTGFIFIRPNWARTRRAVAVPLVAVLAACAFGTGMAVATVSGDELTLTPVTGRPMSSQRCSSELEIRLCLWRELESRRSSIFSQAKRLNATLSQLGLPQVSYIRQGASTRNNVGLIVFPREPDGSFLRALVDGYVKQTASCRTVERGYTDERMAFLALTTRAAAAPDMRGVYAPASIAEAQKWTRQAGTKAAKDWFLAPPPGGCEAK